jgi:hypothetical protein
MKDSHEDRMTRLIEWQNQYQQEQAVLDQDFQLWEGQVAAVEADPDDYR